MGNDAALAVLSDRQPPLFAYFKQLFAQVTNPPIDPIRENVVMSLHTGVGAELNLLAEVPEQAHQLAIAQPILRNHQLEKLRQVSHEIFDAATLDITWPIEGGVDGMDAAVCEALCDEAGAQVDHGANILILSDRNLGPERVAIPSLLAVVGRPPPPGPRRHSAAHGARDRVRRAARHPSHGDADRLRRVGDQPVPDVRVARGAGRALAAARGPEHRGGRRTDRQGDRQGPAEDDLEDGDLDDPVLLRRADLRGGRPGARADRRHFTGTASRIGGVGIDVLASEALGRHFRAYPRTDREVLPVGGVLQWRRDGERHIWNPDTIASLQHAVRAKAALELAAVAPAPTARRNGHARQWQRRRGAVQADARTAGDLRRLRPSGQRRGDPRRRAARADAAALRAGADPAGRGRAGARDRQAVLDRRDEPRLALARVARDARDRDESARRQVQHRRGRGGPRAVHRPTPTATCAARRSSRSRRAGSG